MAISFVPAALAVQEGTFYLGRAHGGRRLLLSGVPGVPRGNVAVLGAGTVGLAAVRTAVGLGADVAWSSWTSTWTGCGAWTTSFAARWSSSTRPPTTSSTSLAAPTS